jgi:hypothetical protein
MSKTLHDLRALKESWLADPCFDIYATEGFEEFREELVAFEATVRRLWQQERQADLETFATKIGCPDNLVLAEYVQQLAARVARLEGEVAK